MKKEVKVFSRLYDIPRGSASNNTIPGCLVLEGGAFRGLYTSGVLDEMMLEGINMHTTVGISAGALNAISYVSGDIGRSAAFNLTYRHDSRWVGMKAVRESHSVTGFRFMFQEGDKALPWNEDRFFHSGRRFVCGATDCLTGKTAYFDQADPMIESAIAASASMPFVSEMVKIRGIPYLDGGCSTKIPIQWAMDQGFNKIIVVNTRDRSYRRKPVNKNMIRLLERVYKECPEFISSFEKTNENYNADCDFMDELEREGRIFRIAPSSPVKVSRLEGDMEKLGQLYFEGLSDTKAVIASMKEYLYQ